MVFRNFVCTPGIKAVNNQAQHAIRTSERAVVGAVAGAAKMTLMNSANSSNGSCGSPNYADELAAATSRKLEQGWPEKVRTMQRNWIGPQPGRARARLPTSAAASALPDLKITVFTTLRRHHLRRNTCSNWRPQHPLVADIASARCRSCSAQDRISLIAEQRKAKKKSGDIGAIEKHGVFTGRYAQATRTTGEPRPQSGSPTTLLMDYGTGAPS